MPTSCIDTIVRGPTPTPELNLSTSGQGEVELASREVHVKDAQPQKEYAENNIELSSVFAEGSRNEVRLDLMLMRVEEEVADMGCGAHCRGRASHASVPNKREPEFANQRLVEIVEVRAGVDEGGSDGRRGDRARA